MKNYFKTIQITQELLLWISIAILLVLPNLLVFSPDTLSQDVITRLYDISHIAVFFVMMIRPMADIFSKTTYIRPLVILRKGTGVLSAAIVVSFMFAKFIMDPSGYIMQYFTASYWSLDNLALLAHAADVSALLLLVTSNSFSKDILGAWWKRIQRLSYVYFYASSIYVYSIMPDNQLLYSMGLVTLATVIAYFINKRKFVVSTSSTTAPVPELVEGGK